MFSIKICYFFFFSIKKTKQKQLNETSIAKRQHQSELKEADVWDYVSDVVWLLKENIESFYIVLLILHILFFFIIVNMMYESIWAFMWKTCQQFRVRKD